MSQERYNKSPALDLDAEYLTRLTFGRDINGPATDFAVSSQPLAGDARVEHEFEFLSAKWTSNRGGTFHAGNKS